ncbi:MAG: DUF512 domain-containing protein [Bacillota bacterium]|nr:DUF512 domain-containing protein [Bacillota bacterium]
MRGKIIEVLPDSIAEEIGIEAGDELLSINGEQVSDLIDYNYHCAEDFLLMEIKKPDGEIWMCELEKDADEEIGLVFASNVFDRIRPCRNHCLFCFIDQLPPKPRASLLLKDDDYRMSFLEGNYVTCTNMDEADYQRISALHLSPLYVSVHTVDPLLRQRMLGRKEPAEILLTLQRLIAGGTQIHAQIVLCPGINDGEHLQRTLDALYALHPGILSVAVVPVGITKYQKNPELRLFTPKEAREIIRLIEGYQEKARAEHGDSFVFAADEFYIRCGQPFPPAAIYGDFAQIEDGIGMAALFLQQWEQCRRNLPEQADGEHIGIVSGICGAAVLGDAVSEMSRIPGANVELLAIPNSHFGETVTVTGLLTASCIMKQIRPGAFDRLIIPDNMLKFDEDIFLDDVTVEQLSERLRIPISIVDSHAASLLDAVFYENQE